MERKFSKSIENTREKETLLVMTNFSFSHRVFKILVLQIDKNKALFGKGLENKSGRRIYCLPNNLIFICLLSYTAKDCFDDVDIGKVANGLKIILCEITVIEKRKCGWEHYPAGDKCNKV